MARLAGRVGLVTGGSNGIGRAVVERFVAEGARMASMDLEPWGGAGEVFGLRGDVAVEADVARAVERTMAAFGRVDVLVNAAATLTPMASVVDLDVESWDAAFAVNLRGAFLMAKSVIPHMRGNGGGCIVNVASEIGIAGSPGRSAYGSSKAGLIHLTKVLALDHAADAIRVNALSPGAVLTDRLLRRFGSEVETERALAPLYPLGRIGRPDEIAAGVLFLASDDAAFMTGANLVMDGGYTAR